MGRSARAMGGRFAPSFWLGAVQSGNVAGFRNGAVFYGTALDRVFMLHFWVSFLVMVYS
jgi:hypothetical protein